MEPKTIARLLKAIDGYDGNFSTCCALRLLPLLYMDGAYRRTKGGGMVGI
ncbi:MAG: hypothetical protein LBS77_05610 [Desulfovibrio sp.]|nr:hypothetical protein [Desulfovibrio sp.]